jgi:hypothetical protein
MGGSGSRVDGECAPVRQYALVHEDDEVVDVLRSRDGIPTEVVLEDGQHLLVLNIAWGYDDREPAAHVTTNVSPSVEGYSVDFFLTTNVTRVLDPTDGTTLYSA